LLYNIIGREQERRDVEVKAKDLEQVMLKLLLYGMSNI
jgi:hypothetical protein